MMVIVQKILEIVVWRNQPLREWLLVLYFILSGLLISLLCKQLAWINNSGIVLVVSGRLITIIIMKTRI